MEIALTAVFKKVPEGYIAFVEELPGANTQGAPRWRRRGRISAKPSSS
jgi:hypothetical protein